MIDLPSILALRVADLLALVRGISGAFRKGGLDR
jgi:hypothetical protein